MLIIVLIIQGIHRAVVFVGPFLGLAFVCLINVSTMLMISCVRVLKIGTLTKYIYDVFMW